MSKRNGFGRAHHFLTLPAYFFVSELILKFHSAPSDALHHTSFFSSSKAPGTLYGPGSSRPCLDWSMLKDRIQINCCFFTDYFSHTIILILLLAVMKVLCRKCETEKIRNKISINRNHSIHQRKPPVIFWYRTVTKLSYELM